MKRSSPGMGRCSAAAGADAAVAVGIAFVAVAVVVVKAEEGPSRLCWSKRATPMVPGARAGAEGTRRSLVPRAGGAARAVLAWAERRSEGIGFFSLFLFSKLSSSSS